MTPHHGDTGITGVTTRRFPHRHNPTIMGDKCLIFFLFFFYQNKGCYNFYMLLILIMNKNLPLHPNSSYYQMCISKRQKSYIIINIIRQPKAVS